MKWESSFSKKNEKYIKYKFPLSLSTIWEKHLPVNFKLKIPYLLFEETTFHLTSKWRGTF